MEMNAGLPRRRARPDRPRGQEEWRHRRHLRQRRHLRRRRTPIPDLNSPRSGMAQRPAQVSLIGPVPRHPSTGAARDHRAPRARRRSSATASVAGLRSGGRQPGLQRCLEGRRDHPGARLAANVPRRHRRSRQRAICPGLIETGMTRPLYDRRATNAARRRARSGQLNPLRRDARSPARSPAVGALPRLRRSQLRQRQAIVVDGDYILVPAGGSAKIKVSVSPPLCSRSSRLQRKTGDRQLQPVAAFVASSYSNRCTVISASNRTTANGVVWFMRILAP